MRFLARGLALVSLLAVSCGGYVAWGYGGCYDPYCYDYYYSAWIPSALAADDVNGDGALDLLVADPATGTVWLVRGIVGGGLDPTPLPAVSLAAASSRVGLFRGNADAFPDLLVIDGDPGPLSVYLNDGAGGFTQVPPALNPAFPLSVNRIARGALDGDALDDLVLMDPGGGVHVLRGTGDGVFADVGAGDPALAFLGPGAGLRITGLHLALAEADATPGLDLIVMDGQRALIGLHSGNGDGTFDPAQSVSFPSLGDVLDIAPVVVRAGQSADLAVLFGSLAAPTAPSTLAIVRLADGGFELDPVTVGSADALFARDLNGDGVSDLLLVDETSQSIFTLFARPR
jgi:hypothetical protein